VIVNEMEIVGRLGEIDPLPTEALDRAEVILRAAMASAQTHERSRRRRGLLAGIAAAVVVLIGVSGVHLATMTDSSRPGQGPRQATRATMPAIALTGGTMRLAAATMHLPAGFQTVPSACAPAPSGLGSSISFLNSSFAAAASANGGCIEAWLADATTTVVPPQAVPVSINSYQGELYNDQGTGFSTLYATIPADLYVDVVSANGQPDPTATIDLVLTANGLSANELESIATAGVPTHPAPFAPRGTSCAGGCG
jgi:hypothetical protein